MKAADSTAVRKDSAPSAHLGSVRGRDGNTRPAGSSRRRGVARLGSVQVVLVAGDRGGAQRSPEDARPGVRRSGRVYARRTLARRHGAARGRAVGHAAQRTDAGHWPEDRLRYPRRWFAHAENGIAF
jgi:hypothetical protein